MIRKFFKNHGPLSIDEIIEISQAKPSNTSYDKSLKVIDIKPLDKAGNTDITFFSNPKYLEQFQNSKAGFCITSVDYIKSAPLGMMVLVSANPYASYARVLRKLYPGEQYSSCIKSTAIIHPTAKIGKDCYIGDYCVIGENVVIGEGTVIHAHGYIGNEVMIGSNCLIESSVTITNTIIGNNTIILSGARIGQDGFGFATDQGKHIKIQHIGSVLIGNDVEIGAGSTIDRGSLDDTIISDGCRIDNLVQIGHNVKLGRGCVVVAQVGIAGSTELGDYCIIGGQAGIAGHLQIASQTTLLAKAGITNHIKESGQTYGGYPASLVGEWRRQSVILRNLAKRKV